MKVNTNISPSFKLIANSPAPKPEKGQNEPGYIPFENYPEFMTIKDLSKETGINTHRITQLVNSGAIPAIRFEGSRRWLIPKAKLITMIEGEPIG